MRFKRRGFHGRSSKKRSFKRKHGKGGKRYFSYSGSRGGIRL